jgi:hypothetical protein
MSRLARTGLGHRLRLPPELTQTVVLANLNLIDTLRADLPPFLALIFGIVGRFGSGAGLHA